MIHKLDEIKRYRNLDRRVRVCIKDSLKQEGLQSRDARLRLARRVNRRWKHYFVDGDGYVYGIEKRRERLEKAHDCGDEAVKKGVH